MPGPANSAFDPFGPKQDKGHADFYIHYCRSIVISADLKQGSGHFDEVAETPERSRAPLTRKDRYSYNDIYPVIFSKEALIRLLVFSPAVLHGILFHTAVDLCLQRGNICTSDMIFHHAEAVMLHSEANPRDRSQINISAYNDSSWSLGSIRGTIHSNEGVGTGTKEHMDGFVAMVDSRGGLDTVSEESSLGLDIAFFISWTDTIISIFFNTPARSQLSRNLMKCEPWARYRSEPCPTLARRYEAKLLNLKGSEAQTRHLIELYCVLQDCLPLPKDIGHKLVAKGEIAQVLFYKSQLEFLELRAPLLYQSPLDVESKLLIFPLFGCAALRHTFLFMHEAKAAPASCNVLSSRMKGIMNMVELRSLQIQYSELILWVIVMGGLGSRGGVDHQWFANLIAETCEKSGLRGVDEVGLTLGEFLWLPEYHGPRTRGLWDAVAVAQNYMEVCVKMRYDLDTLVVAALTMLPDMVEAIPQGTLRFRLTVYG